MKNRTLIKFILVVLIIIFELQFISHLLQTFAPEDPDKDNARFYKLSQMFFPKDAESTYMYGYSLLVRSRLKGDPKLMEKSIKYFRRAINQNMLFYRAHFFLAKAYLQKSTANPQYFSEALQSFKRAIQIRRNNTEVGVEALTLLLSLWPHLNQADQNFCRSLFMQLLPRLKRSQFLPILDAWGYYVKDFDLMSAALRGAPHFYFDVAQAIPKFDLDLGLRVNLLAKNEVFQLEQIKATLQELSRTRMNYATELDKVYRLLKNRIKGYYQHVEKTSFNERNYFEIKGQIEQNLLKIKMSSLAWQNELKKRQELIQFLQGILDTTNVRLNLERIRDILDKNGFFNLNDLPVFYIHQQIDFKLNQIDELINKTEALKHSISFVKKEHLETYTKILLLLARAYYANRLLSRAMSILHEVRKIDPENLEIYWQMARIEQILGRDEAEDPQRDEMLERLKKRKQITLHSSSWAGRVYLMGDIGFNIDFSASLKKKLADYRILRIFIDGRIHQEMAITGAMEPIPVVVPDSDRFSRFKVEVTLNQ